jgi:hypothetical protein
MAEVRYSYEPLYGNHTIRLLCLCPGSEQSEIRCYLKTVSLYGNSVYEALSYVWGDPQNTRRILCGNGYLNITTNLHSFLHSLRDANKERILWADAICNVREVFTRSPC